MLPLRHYDVKSQKSSTESALSCQFSQKIQCMMPANVIDVHAQCTLCNVHIDLLLCISLFNEFCLEMKQKQE